MDNPIKLGLYVLIGIVVGSLVLKFVWGAITAILSLVVPLAIVGAIGLIVYGLICRKCIGGGGRSLP